MELIDLFNGDYVIDKLIEAHKLYVMENFTDYPGKHIRFRRFAEKVLAAVLKNDQHAFSLLIPNNQYIFEDLNETLVSSKLIKAWNEDSYYYYITYLGSLNLICIEREPK